MATTSASAAADTRPPDDQARVRDSERLRVYSEDWVTMPRRADSGALLGETAHRQVIDLLRRGVDEASIRGAALDALAAAEARIARRHRLQGWLVFGGCIGLAVLAAVLWEGRSDGQHITKIALLGALGLTVARAIHMRGLRRRRRLLVSEDARKTIWRDTVGTLVRQSTPDR
jgi:hypothetical protein